MSLTSELESLAEVTQSGMLSWLPRGCSHFNSVRFGLKRNLKTTPCNVVIQPDDDMPCASSVVTCSGWKDAWQLRVQPNLWLRSLLRRILWQEATKYGVETWPDVGGDKR